MNGARLNWWGYRQYGVDALIALNRSAEALRYAEASRRLNAPTAAIARKCEAILLSSGMMDEAYRRYAIEANQATTHLATFRAIAKNIRTGVPTAFSATWSRAGHSGATPRGTGADATCIRGPLRRSALLIAGRVQCFRLRGQMKKKDRSRLILLAHLFRFGHVALA